MRARCATKRGAPGHCEVTGGAAPTIQRVAAVEASLGGVARSRNASAPLSAAARESRRTATSSIRPARISPITTPAARERRASSIAHSRSRRCATLTITNRSGARPKASRPAPCGAPFSASAISSAIQKMLRLFPACPAKPKAKPAVAAIWGSPGAAISCRAPRRSPPPRTSSMAGMPNGRGSTLFSSPGRRCKANRLWRSSVIISLWRNGVIQFGLDLCSCFVLVYRPNEGRQAARNRPRGTTQP